MKLLLAIDIGTSGCKMTFFNLDGEVVASHTGSYNTYYPGENCVEQSPEEWWSTICSGVKEMIHENHIDIGHVAGIGVDGHGWGFVPVDQEGKALRNCMIWLDRRATKQAETIKQMVDENEIIELSGNPVDAAYITPKILWVKENEPEIYAKINQFLQSNSYIGFKMTGTYYQDYSLGYGYHFFDIKKGVYDERMAKRLGIDLKYLPPLVKCHEVIGTLTEPAAEELGLLPDTPVVAGGLDAACCTLGAGVIHQGETQEQGGQAGGMSIMCDAPMIHPKLILGYHVVPDKWLLQGGTVGGGGTINWFNRELAAFEQQKAKETNTNVFEIISEEAGEIEIGSNGLIFLPYMAGERSPIWDSYARGVFFGLSYDKTREHMIRSMMEGVGYSLLHNLETAYEVGATVNQLNSVGGSANSSVWTQLKADITGKTINVPYADHATTLGTAILAGVGTGCYGSFDEAVRRTVKFQKTYEPDFENNRKYREYYNVYLELYQKLRDIYVSLAALNNR